jgi:O-methyltransferase involved in polyketide biosynthesis
MQNAPSLTAKTVALLRAAHQLMDGGTIYPDPLAVSILGEDVDVISGFVREHPEFDRLRLFTAARSRFAEDCIASAVARDVRQVVVLGAGLDTSGFVIPTPEKNSEFSRSTVRKLSNGSVNVWPRQTCRFLTG